LTTTQFWIVGELFCTRTPAPPVIVNPFRIVEGPSLVAKVTTELPGLPEMVVAPAPDTLVTVMPFPSREIDPG
jgi:hypothetical protein